MSYLHIWPTKSLFTSEVKKTKTEYPQFFTDMIGIGRVCPGPGLVLDPGNTEEGRGSCWPYCVPGSHLSTLQHLIYPHRCKVRWVGGEETGVHRREVTCPRSHCWSVVAVGPKPADWSHSLCSRALLSVLGCLGAEKWGPGPVFSVLSESTWQVLKGRLERNRDEGERVTACTKVWWWERALFSEMTVAWTQDDIGKGQRWQWPARCGSPVPGWGVWTLTCPEVPMLALHLYWSFVATLMLHDILPRNSVVCISSIFLLPSLWVSWEVALLGWAQRGSAIGASQVALVVKNPPAGAGDAGDAGLSPGLGRSPGEGNGNTLQCSCLENPTDSWRATVHSIAQSRSQLKWLSMHLLRSWGLKSALHLSQSSGVNNLPRASFHGNSGWQERKLLKYI